MGGGVWWGRSGGMRAGGVLSYSSHSRGQNEKRRDGCRDTCLPLAPAVFRNQGEEAGLEAGLEARLEAASGVARSFPESSTGRTKM